MFRLIMECHAGGLTPHEWCMQNNIRPGSLYNWGKHFRKNECTEIPKAVRGQAHCRQEVVKLGLISPDSGGSKAESSLSVLR